MTVAADFAVLPPDEQTEALAVLAHELTVAARDSYEAGGDGLREPARVRALNEVQHRVTAHLAALLRGDAARYPDDVLTAIILDHPGDDVLRGQVAAAFARALGLATSSSLQPAAGG